MFKRKGQVDFSKHRVQLIECERGWGCKVDETIYFETEEIAKLFVLDFNSVNTDMQAPDWYMTAEYSKIG